MKTITYPAQLLSAVFRPAFYPLVGFIILFTLTYLSLLPMFFKLLVLATVYLFTIALPYLLHLVTRKIYGWTRHDMSLQHRRSISYCINIACYSCCMTLCQSMRLPAIMNAILMACLMVQCSCVIVNIWYKVSIRSAGTGLIIGMLMAYSLIFHFNPTWWLCGAILLSGAVMSSRMLLGHHSLGQVLSGTAIGIACGLMGIVL
ncbi:MAG: hypothetical protein K2J00_06515 [Bacteroidaceae bacterium]|nr:hypothetical protein [Bacteroidaceae bacterium]